MQPRAERGFTLIEVLAALIIVGLGMLAVIKGVSEAVRNSTYMRDKTLAHWIAMNKLAEVRLSGRFPEVAKTSGDLEYAGGRWRWKMTITQTQVQSMRRIDINVRRDGMDEKVSLAAITGFYGNAVERAGVVSTSQNYSPLLAGTGNPRRESGGSKSDSGSSSDSNSESANESNEQADEPTGPVPEPGSEDE